MEAEIYGITPNAKIEARENEPPANIFSKPTNPSLAFWLSKVAWLTPGRITNEPTRYIKRNKSVLVIRTLRSSIFQILDIVVKNFFIETYNLTMVPPAASIAF